MIGKFREKDFTLKELLQFFEELNMLYNKADQVYWLATLAEKRFIFISASCEKMYGLSPEAFYQDAELWKKVVHPEDKERLEKAQSVLWNGESVEQEYRIIHQHDGTVRWVLEKTFPVFGEAGNVAMLSGIITDITKIKKMDEQLLLAEKVYEYTQQALLITDAHLMIQLINPAFTNMTGYGADIIGESFQVLCAGYYDERFYSTMRKTITEKGKWAGKMRWRRKNGKAYVQQTTVTAVRNREGQIIFYLFLLADMWRSKKTAATVKDDLKLAREVQKRVLSKPLTANRINIYGTYIPSRELGGDMYAWYRIDEERYGIFLMDVMGQGTAASLICMSVRSLLNGVIRKGIDPQEVFQELNKHMRRLYHENGRMMYYFTAIYVLVNTKERFIEYASAGHPPGFLFQRNGLVEELDQGCAPIGLLPHLYVEAGKLHYEPGATLVLYSDGAIEGTDRSVRTNIEKFREQLKPHIHLDSKTMIKYIHSQFKEKRAVPDDLSVVVAKLW
jgi:phosphoserine phosphatase RsbU/P